MASLRPTVASKKSKKKLGILNFKLVFKLRELLIYLFKFFSLDKII